MMILLVLIVAGIVYGSWKAGFREGASMKIQIDNVTKYIVDLSIFPDERRILIKNIEKRVHIPCDHVYEGDCACCVGECEECNND